MKKIIILLVAFAAGFVSCNKFTDLEPFDYISDQNAMSNLENATASLTAVYGGLRAGAYYGRNFVVWGDTPTDNVLVAPNNSNRFLGQSQWSMTAAYADLADLWNSGYSRLRRINNILDNVDNVPDATDADKARIKGEALALRALVHFDMVRIFAQTYVGNGSALGIPYISTVPVPTDFPSREPVSAVYTKIVADLDQSISLLVDDFSLPAASRRGPIHITQNAVKALKARVALTMAEYSTAKALAVEVINSGRYSLVSNANYVNSWTTIPSSESIFTLIFTNNDYGATGALGYIYLQAGYGDLRVPAAFKALFDADDIRQCFFKAGTAAEAAFTFVNKYPGRGVTGLDNFNILRLSEMYLIAAEAAARTNDETTAREYLDAIRQRALPAAPAATETGPALIDAILLEKRKELCYEGHYYFDLKRLQMTITSAVNQLNVPYKTIPYPSSLLAAPIPQREIDANPNMVQNPD